MQVKNKKITLIITLTMIALLADIITLLDFTGLLSFHWLDKVAFFRWGWLLVFITAAIALNKVICSRFENLSLRRTIIFILICTLVFAFPWFFAICFFKLPT